MYTPPAERNQGGTELYKAELMNEKGQLTILVQHRHAPDVSLGRPVQGVDLIEGPQDGRVGKGAP